MTMHMSLADIEILLVIAEGEVMNTQFVTVNPAMAGNEYCPGLEEAARILHAGGLVAFPTETVYGLGGDALDADASRKIYEAKGRPSDNPLIVHIAEAEQVNEIARDISERAEMLMDVFWPGPLTMIFHKKDIVPDSTTGGLDTVAVRMPSHPVAYELLYRSGVMIAAPSANTSGRPSPTRASHVREDLDGKIDMILDGGNCEYGIESTIVDMTGKIPTILRPGYITKEMLEDVIGPVAYDDALADSSMPPRAPGMKYTHYAPKGELTIVEASNDSNSLEIAGTIHSMNENQKVIDRINQLAAMHNADGYRVGVLATIQNARQYQADAVISLGAREDELMISANLYCALREFDEQAIDYIYSESFENTGLGTAIMNRLMKAAGHRVIRV